MPPAHAARRAKKATRGRILVGLIAVAVLLAAGRLAVGVADRSSSSSAAGAVTAVDAATTTDAWSSPSRPAGRAGAQGLSGPSSRAVPSRSTSSAAAPPASSPPGRHWQRMLASLDQVRAQAWRQTRPGLLRQVYLPSAPEGKRDRAMLREYADLGLHVRGVSLAFGSVRVAHRAPGAIRLRVVDQLQPATAVDKQGHRLELPRDRPTRHTIELRRFRGGWRIADVRMR